MRWTPTLTKLFCAGLIGASAYGYTALADSVQLPASSSIAASDDDEKEGSEEEEEEEEEDEESEKSEK